MVIWLDGIWPFTGPPFPCIPWTCGRVGLIPTPCGTPFGIPFGAPAETPFGKPFGAFVVTDGALGF